MRVKKIFNVLFLLTSMVLMTTCGGEIEIDAEHSSVSISGVDLPSECYPTTFQINIEQTVPGTSNLGAPVYWTIEEELFYTLEEGDEIHLKMTNLNFNFHNPVKITVGVYAKNKECEEFSSDTRWVFEGTMTPEGDNRFSVSFSEFDEM